MTPEQIVSVLTSGDREQAALAFVQTGEATLIEFKRESVVAKSKNVRRRLNPSVAPSRIRWDRAHALVDFDFPGLLYRDGERAVLAGGLRDCEVESYLDVLCERVERQDEGRRALAEIDELDSMYTDELLRDGDSGRFTDE